MKRSILCAVFCAGLLLGSIINAYAKKPRLLYRITSQED